MAKVDTVAACRDGGFGSDTGRFFIGSPRLRVRRTVRGSPGLTPAVFVQLHTGDMGNALGSAAAFSTVDLSDLSSEFVGELR